MPLATSRPSGPSRPRAMGMTKGTLSGWPGVAGQLWDRVRFVAARGGVVAARRLDARRAGLAVPALELGQQPCQLRFGVGVGDGLREVVAGDGLAVVALEVQRHAAGEALAAHQGLHHAHDLGAFFVHGHRVEVVDLQVLVGAHRVRHGAGVLGELGGAQHAHVLDALDGAGRGLARQVLAELLVAENGEAFLQAQLEPVAAGHAVAGPVVEVLVADHATRCCE